ncbi:hypothetical protein DDB_G0280387 [Dictyostelium discoideum AX4]|uniref:Uncharacterized protein n=1 Tax=Dictyostelium discoideum TaxID=44689 RepID=Q54VL0_DICDI|nr:hypothetical protein DDB_G0280387 [Dictyostelium discoideum AX4]EAL67420.1 hypothetical protein DDB_G0280387 [Dictyostelium discoideum AX4]|eukprot:XP_641345.1 hypothetical protein DDB_G0280387 [Dictyostelium discoideum AX4]
MKLNFIGGQNRQGPTTSSNKPSGRSGKISQLSLSLSLSLKQLINNKPLLTFIKIKKKKNK